MKVGRNDPCPCGSELKYKKCCMDKDQASRSEAATAAAASAPPPAPDLASAKGRLPEPKPYYAQRGPTRPTLSRRRAG